MLSVSVAETRRGAGGSRRAVWAETRSSVAGAEGRARVRPAWKRETLDISGTSIGIGAGEVRGGDLHQDAALDGALVGDADLAVGEVAQAAVDQLGGPARRAEGEVVGVDGERGQSAGGGVEGDAGAGDAEADDEHVDVVGEVGEAVAAECGSSRGEHPAR